MSRVFLLADDARVRDQLEGVLRGQRHVVQSRSMGDFAAGEARDFDPDIVIMDLASNGAAAPVRLALLRDPELKRVPLIAVASSADEARAFAAQAYLPRSLHADDVTHVIEALLRPQNAEEDHF
jgi:DNA-binding response OmpR family regulator